MKKRKKRMLIAASVMISIFLVAIGICYYQKKKNVLSVEVQSEMVQYFSGTVDCMALCEKNAIEIDDNYKNVIKENCKKILQKLNKEEISVLTLMEVINIDSYFQLGYDEKLYLKLQQYYDSENKVLTSLPMASYTEQGLKDENRIISAIDYELSEIYNLNERCSRIEELQLEEGFIQWYEAYTMDSSNTEKQKEYEEELLSIFWYFNATNQLERIDIAPMKKFLEKYIKKQEKIFVKGNYENNISNVFVAKQCADYNKVFENDNSLLQLPITIFNAIDSEKGFEYEADDELYFCILSSQLREVETLSGNTFFTKNINHWLQENYDTCIKKLCEETFR